MESNIQNFPECVCQISDTYLHSIKLNAYKKWCLKDGILSHYTIFVVSQQHIRHFCKYSNFQTFLKYGNMERVVMSLGISFDNPFEWCRLIYLEREAQ